MTAAPAYPSEPPEAGLPVRLACWLLAHESPLATRVLERLASGPRRYSELRPLLEGRHDHNLTVALKRLQEEGLARRRTQARATPVVHVYEPTELGRLALASLRRIRSLDAEAEAAAEEGVALVSGGTRYLLYVRMAPAKGGEPKPVYFFASEAPPDAERVLRLPRDLHVDLRRGSGRPEVVGAEGGE